MHTQPLSRRTPKLAWKRLRFQVIFKQASKASVGRVLIQLLTTLLSTRRRILFFLANLRRRPATQRRFLYSARPSQACAFNTSSTTPPLGRPRPTRKYL